MWSCRGKETKQGCFWSPLCTGSYHIGIPYLVTSSKDTMDHILSLSLPTHIYIYIYTSFAFQPIYLTLHKHFQTLFNPPSPPSATISLLTNTFSKENSSKKWLWVNQTNKTKLQRSNKS